MVAALMFGGVEDFQQRPALVAVQVFRLDRGFHLEKDKFGGGVRHRRDCVVERRSQGEVVQLHAYLEEVGLG